MKIILSRKGFDSANGGIVSPIFEDGTMVSFPIPSDDEDTYDSLYYNGIPYSKILHDLRYKGGNHCHVDPDLDLSRRAKEIDGWFPAFGQRDAAASYLKNLGVAPGDIFLFFGNLSEKFQTQCLKYPLAISPLLHYDGFIVNNFAHLRVFSSKLSRKNAKMGGISLMDCCKKHHQFKKVPRSVHKEENTLS